tara:strand:- start:1615 stop:1770 length:156 start_codon:yes stop_codon:yes gene_type:complete
MEKSMGGANHNQVLLYSKSSKKNLQVTRVKIDPGQSSMTSNKKVAPKKGRH